MSQVLLIICGGFGFGAITCAIQCTLIRAGKFHRNPFLGVATSVTKVSEKVWDRAHAAALPWIGRAGILAGVAAVVAGVGLLVDGAVVAKDAFLFASGALGIAAICVFSIKAEGAARRAAVAPEPDE